MNVAAVTGAGGTIGRHLVEYLKPRVGEIRVLLLPNEPVPPVCADAKVYRGDIRKSDDLRGFLDGADTVFHLAALVGKDADDHAAAYAVNVEGTRNLVDLSKALGVRKLVLLSTCCVYGLYGFAEETLDERAPHAPLPHPYDQTKTQADEMVSAEDPSKLAWSVLQVPVVLGGAHTVNKPNLMAHIKLAQSGFTPFGIGAVSWANLVYAGDVAAALARIGGDPRAAGEVFIYNETAPLNDVFSWIAKDLEIDVRRVPVPSAALRIAARGYGRLALLANRRRFSSAKLRDRLGFVPPVGLQEGLRMTIAHYRKSGLLG
jgi:nucleoside-diphosphate-sugar epimerase